MNISSLMEAAIFNPRSIQSPGGWVGHLPFASWVIQQISPKIFVELGTHSGNSYFTFCQSVVESGISVKCFAIDTWQGDAHSGTYGNEIFTKVSDHNQKYYADISQLLRTTFDDAVNYFNDESIDLLHIDGLHTYEAVRHDFEIWLPKLAPGAIVVFHDTNVREHGFGVWKLWEELQSIYHNNLEFLHSHGLGVLQLNNAPTDKMLEWLQPSYPEKHQLINYFSSLGAFQFASFELQNLKKILLDKDVLISNWEKGETERDVLIDNLNKAAIILNNKVDQYEIQVNHLDEQLQISRGLVFKYTEILQSIYNSNIWRLLTPLRYFGQQRLKVKRMMTALSSPICNALFNSHQQSITHFKDKSKHRADSLIVRPEILFISHEASRTGAPIFLINLIKSLKRQLNVDCIVILRQGGALEDEFNSIAETVVLSHNQELSEIDLEILSKRNIKLIYSNTITNGPIQKQFKDLNIPIICHVHELGFSIENFFSKTNLEQVLDTTTLFLSGSKAVSSYLNKSLSIPEDKINLAYPFVNVAQNQKKLSNLPKVLDIKDDVLVVGTCGTFCHRKGPDIFVQIAQLVLQKTNCSIVFVWVGGSLSNEDYLKLRQDTKLMGIDNSVIFLDSVESHIPYLSEFDIFLLPSREDPFPLVVLDAGSLGIPVVCFEGAGGAPELIEDDAGRVSRYLDINEISDAIVELSENSALREKLGQRLKEKVTSNHDIDVGSKKISTLISHYL